MKCVFTDPFQSSWWSLADWLFSKLPQGPDWLNTVFSHQGYAWNACGVFVCECLRLDVFFNEYAFNHTYSTLRLIQDQPTVLMSTIHHYKSSRTWPGVSSGGHRIHNMPLHQHSSHLCRQTTGDRSQITGDCNQTPVIANKRRLWQLSRLEMPAVPQRVMSAFITRSDCITSILVSQHCLASTFFRDYLSRGKVWLQVWRAACDAKQVFPALSADRRPRLTRPSKIQTDSFLHVFPCTQLVYVFAVVAVILLSPVYFINLLYSWSLYTRDLKSNNQLNDVCFVSLELRWNTQQSKAYSKSVVALYALMLLPFLIRRIVSESHFCSHAYWLLSLTLVRCNRYCKPKVRPKNRAVGGVALAGLGIVHILSSVSMVTCAFSHCQHGSRIQKIVPSHQWLLFLSL